MNRLQKGRRIWDKQRGDVVISAILVLVILAFIAIFAYRSYQAAMEKNRIEAAVGQIQKLSQGIDQLYVNSHNFADITTKVVINAGIADKTNVVGDQIVAPWYPSNNKSLVSVTQGAQPNMYSISMAGIPAESCSLVGSTFLSNGAASLAINDVSVTDIGALTTNCVTNTTGTLTVSF